MRKDNSEFISAFLSEAGTHIQNRDYYACVEQDDKACWVLAHGLDTDREVDSAELVAKSILGNFMHKPTLSRWRIKHYIRQAHRLLQEESKRVRLKATLVVIVTDYSKIMWATVGNARFYHFRNGHLHLRSHDQSLAQVLANNEEIPQDRLDTHEERHNLLHYLGKPGYIEPFLSKKQRLMDGDILLLCSAGMWEGVDGAEMADAVEAAQDPQELVDTLEEVLLSKQRRHVDNYTAAAIFANKTFQEDPGKKWRIAKQVAVAVCLFALLGGGAWYYQAQSMARQAETAASILDHDKNGDAFVQDKDYAKALKEYSEGRNAAIKVKDKVHTQLIGKKHRVTQLIVDGDTLAKDGDYGKALTKYESAKKEAKNQELFDQQELEDKIYQMKSYIQVMNWVKEGDLRAEKQDYIGALAIYQQAKLAAIEASFTAGDQEIKQKMLETQAKMTGLQQAKHQLDAEKQEKLGDDSLAQEDYNGAMDAYITAQEIYQEAGMMEKVLGVERKIAKVQEKLNPEPLAASAMLPGAGVAGAAGFAGIGVGMVGNQAFVPQSQAGVMQQVPQTPQNGSKQQASAPQPVQNGGTQPQSTQGVVTPPIPATQPAHSGAIQYTETPQHVQTSSTAPTRTQMEPPTTLVPTPPAEKASGTDMKGMEATTEQRREAGGTP
ncbi:PP2C family protein-serine/threonine phosphatase [Brevibacillus dissolubilis]|uniref:PP2C family protein-serine/threonine phosphatase n=1 Tax=Brevibacillus dissolubilis TaxID=1844116 RepID=UPI0011166614|nr:serine/threonine protein phosphatase [Brevibacillus dissolubilis]